MSAHIERGVAFNRMRSWRSDLAVQAPRLVMNMACDLNGGTIGWSDHFGSTHLLASS